MHVSAIAATGIRTARHLTASLCLPLLLDGCIASYSIQHDEPIEAVPDTALVCRYSWLMDEPHFRSENIFSHQWAPASSFGHHDLAAALSDFTSACPASDSADRPEARISTHALRRVNKTARGVMAVPMLFATGYTLDFMPNPMTDYFVVCLEITSPDGPRRAAIAQGQLDRFKNVWGSSNHRLNQGKDEQRQELDQAIREVTVQAWRRAWAPRRMDCKRHLPAGTSSTPLRRARQQEAVRLSRRRITQGRPRSPADWPVRASARVLTSTHLSWRGTI